MFHEPATRMSVRMYANMLGMQACWNENREVDEDSFDSIISP